MDAKDHLYLFTGENTFTLNEELLRWKENFLAKHGEANLQILEGKTMDWRAFLDETRAAPFLSEKRLVTVDGIPAQIAKEDLESLLQEMHPSTIVVFAESAPDKRKAVTKFLVKNATVKTFGKQTPKQLVSWLTDLAKQSGSTIAPNVAAHLIAIVGTDQWHLKNECLKVIAYSSSQSVEEKNHIPNSNKTKNESTNQRINDSPTPTIQDINRVCLPSQKHTVWVMSDLIGKGQVEEAVKLARSLHESGEDAYSLWNIYLWIMKNLSTIWMYQQEKNAPVGVISKEAGIPYLGVQSLLPCAQKFTAEEMSTLLESVVDADRALKTGEIKATGGEPGELMAMLERRILSVICRS